MSVTVISSQTIINGIQKDGRRYVQEIFNLSNGRIEQVVYLSDAGFDTGLHLADDATQLIADLTASEINDNINQVTTLGSLAAPNLVFSAAPANFAALRIFYAAATQIQAVMVGDFLNTLTNGQLQTAFGITAGQVTTLRTNKLTPAANIADSIRASAGQ